MGTWQSAAAYGWVHGELVNRAIRPPEPKGSTPMLKPCDEKFAEARDGEGVEVSLMYPALGMENACGRCIMRKSVLGALRMAASMLPPGYRIRVWDAWRPWALQEELYEKYRSRIIGEQGLGGKSEEEKDAAVARFVAPPSGDRDDPPAHTTGGAVDVTIAGPDGEELDMGTGFDSFSEMAGTDWFERNGGSPEARENRRVLHNAMAAAGFTNLPSEWWHYDLGDANWSRITGKPARYRGVFNEGEAGI